MGRKIEVGQEFAKAKQAQIANLESQLKQLAAARDETIKAKDAQVETLKTQIQNLSDLSPAKLKEHMTGISSILEKRIEITNEELKRKESELHTAEEKITAIQNKPDEARSAEQEQEKLAGQVKQLQSQIDQLRQIQSEVKDQTAIPPILYLRELNLVDKDNKIRAVLTTLLDGEPSLYFYGEDGYQPGKGTDFRVSLGIDDDEWGWQSLRMVSKDRRTIARVGVQEESATIELESRRPEGVSHIQFIIQDDGHPVLYLGNQNSKTIAVLEMKNDRPPRLELVADGKIVWRWQDSQ